MRRTFRIGLAALAIGAFIVPRAAHADASTSAAAEALYDEGKRLETKGDFTSACPKFAESQKLDPAAGTLLHLANCYEKTNKPASAWVTYLDAASAARAQNRADWEKAARSKAAALEPKIPKMVINVASADPNEIVKRDDTVVAAASFGVPIPVDPGPHAITAEAPKKKPFTTTVDVAGEGKTDVAIPKLEDAPDATPPPPPGTDPSKTEPAHTQPKDEGTSGRKIIGYTLGSVGIVGLGVGAVTGLMAISANNTAKSDCPSSGACASKDGVDSNNNSKTLGTISSVGFIGGGVLLVAGVVLVFTAPSSTEKKAEVTPPKGVANTLSNVSVAPAFGPGNAGFLLRGAF